MALNKTVLIFGFQPNILVVIFIGVAVGIMSPLPKLLVAGFGAVALLVAKRCAKDPIGLVIFCRALFQRAKYVPTMREVFRMEIEG